MGEGMTVKRESGYTLVELIVVMAIFVVVIMLVGQSFNVVLTQAAKLFKSEESNIDGMVGLEMLRHDLNQAGYGLFTEPAAAAYTGEAAAGTSVFLNDPFTGPPRPVVALERSAAGCSSASGQPDDQGYALVPCSDYLALKGTTLGMSPAAQRWTYLNISDHSATPNVWPSAAENPRQGDSVVLVNRMVSASANSATLVPTSSGGFYHQFGSAAFNGYTSLTGSTVNAYGIDSQPLRMPFNRADYFVAKPPQAAQMSAACAPGTGVLYKATVNQSDGRLTYIPLLDCVAGMQVVLGWDTNADGVIDTWSNADGSVVSGTAAVSDIQQSLSPAGNAGASNGLSIRNSLKMVKLYVLAQNGRKDPNYNSPSPILAGDTGEESLTYPYDIVAAGWQNYRWRLYRLVATPKNLDVNQ